MAKDVWILEIRDGESFYSVWETKAMAIEGAIQDYREHSDAMGIDKESVEEAIPGIRTALDEDEFFDDCGASTSSIAAPITRLSMNLTNRRRSNGKSERHLDV